ncbi:DEKNAAC105433 [Brettanomyces naardenensis]|uniref:DEKNAAC105433 n=1 Tax=Brettanomyces naardenensis TaxID=13370 RepID=A0A448YTL4_BRENA|nr:DEKNAAC105433 [Brettanomyces naardenensis]
MSRGKRPLNEGTPTDYSHATKRRLIDNLEKLHLSDDGSKRKHSKNGLFGEIEDDGTDMSDYDGYYSDSDRIVIPDIDQYLRENQQDERTAQTDTPIGDRIEDFQNVDLEKLIIPDFSSKSRIRDYIARKLMLDTEGKKVGQEGTSYEKLYYLRKYVAKYFSLIKYYDPKTLVWRVYLRWKRRRKDEDEDEDEEMIDDEGDQLVRDDPVYGNGGNLTSGDEMSID